MRHLLNESVDPNSSSPFTALTVAVLHGAITLPERGRKLTDSIDDEIRRLRDCEVTIASVSCAV